MFDTDQFEFLCQVAIKCDRANEEMTPAQVQSQMLKLCPSLTNAQAMNHFYRSFKKAHEGKLKHKSVKAQKTTLCRSQCTVVEQYCWRKTVDKALDLLRDKNTGLCRKSGKSFGELIQHFVIGGDETCLPADADVDVKIIGEFGKIKHEKLAGD